MLRHVHTVRAGYCQETKRDWVYNPVPNLSKDYLANGVSKPLSTYTITSSFAGGQLMTTLLKGD